MDREVHADPVILEFHRMFAVSVGGRVVERDGVTACLGGPSVDDRHRYGLAVRCRGSTARPRDDRRYLPEGGPVYERIGFTTVGLDRIWEPIAAR
jgi:hypothetical protein